mgnify:CR=1 FL=1
MNEFEQFEIHNVSQLKKFHREHGFAFVFSLDEEIRSFTKEKYKWLFKTDGGIILGEYQKDMKTIENPLK